MKVYLDIGFLLIYKCYLCEHNIIGGVRMSEIEDLLKDVEILRNHLVYLIEIHKGNLVDPDVITASKILNAALNQYNKFIKEKIDK